MGGSAPNQVANDLKEKVSKTTSGTQKAGTQKQVAAVDPQILHKEAGRMEDKIVPGSGAYGLA